MPDKISKTQRWLDLIALLLNRKVPLSVEEILERVPAYAKSWSVGDKTSRDTVRRMFERDKDELRAAGIAIESIDRSTSFGNEIVQGYSIAGRDFYLPNLRILDGEQPASAPRMGAAELTLEPEEARAALD